jgi:hypothetical protein
MSNYNNIECASSNGHGNGNHRKDRFIPYQTLYEIFNDQSFRSPLDYYQEGIYTYASKMPPDPDAKVAILAPLIMEYQYYRNDTPYFKVPSKMIPAMSQTCLNRIPVHDLKLPFSSFAVLLPEDNPTGIQQILVCLYSEKALLNPYEVISPLQTWHLCMIVKGKESRLCCIEIDRQYGGNSVSDCLPTKQNTQHSEAVFYSDMEREAWKIAISTILLTTGSHKHFTTGVMDHLLDEFATINQNRRKYIHTHQTNGGSLKGSDGWDSHRKLVNGMGESQDNGASSNDGQHLHPHTPKKPHHRGGHRRMQACGKNWQNRVEIYIHPMKIHSNSII